MLRFPCSWKVQEPFWNSWVTNGILVFGYFSNICKISFFLLNNSHRPKARLCTCVSRMSDPNTCLYPAPPPTHTAQLLGIHVQWRHVLDSWNPTGTQMLNILAWGKMDGFYSFRSLKNQTGTILLWIISSKYTVANKDHAKNTIMPIALQVVKTKEHTSKSKHGTKSRSKIKKDIESHENIFIWCETKLTPTRKTQANAALSSQCNRSAPNLQGLFAEKLNGKTQR